MNTHAHQHHGTANNTIKVTSHATLHCLIGCSIGEILGLMIGVTIGLAVWSTITLATILAFIFGVGLAVMPLMRGASMGLIVALKTIWLGEVISIAVMEIVMNAVDY